MKRILFICLGNICRSCTAQTILQHIVDTEGLTDQFHIDSAGILDYHEGEMADSRMRKHAARRGYEITHRSRPVRPEDFLQFDYVIGMDDSNIRDLKRIAAPMGHQAKVHRMTQWCRKYPSPDVPDPYYGGDQGFEHVLDLLEDACQGLFEEMTSEPA